MLITTYLFIKLMKQQIINNDHKKHFKQKYYDFKTGKRLVAFLNSIPELEKIKFRLSE